MLQSIETIEAFDALLRASAEGPVLLLKHSTRCPISAGAHARYLRFAEAHPETSCAVVLVIEHRPVSQHIAAATGVPHQSPQALLLRDGQCVWHASHHSITEAALAGAVG